MGHEHHGYLYVLHALAPGTNKSELARSYGISRARLYQILDEELADAEGKLRAAEAELSFRRRVVEARHH